jgi:hypothetical protein
MYEEQAAANSAAGDEGTGSTLRPPGGDSVPQRAADGSIRWKPRSAPKSAPSKSEDESIGQARRAGRDGGLAEKPSAVGLKVSNPGMKKGPAPPKPRRDRTILFVTIGGGLAVVGLLLLGLRGLFLPGYIKSTAIEAAAAHGVTLTVADASVSSTGVLLSGLTAKLTGVPQISFSIASADVRSVWSSPVRVVLGKTEIAVDGDVQAVSGAVQAWSRLHRGKGKPDDETMGGQIEIPSVHLLWIHVGRDISRIEASGAQGGVGSPTATALGDDVHFLAPSFSVESTVGTFGPWQVSVDTSMKETRARVAFDPAVPDGANALLVDDTLGHSSFDVTIPRLPTSSLGIPRSVAGADLPFPEQIEVLLHFGRVSQDQSTGSLRAALYGLRIPELGSGVDARLSGDVSGPVGGPLTVKNGLASLGPLHAPVTGTLTPEGAGKGMRANLAWKADPIPCSTLAGLPTPGAAVQDLTKKAVQGDLSDLGELARDFGAIGEAVGAVKVTGSFAASGTVVVSSVDPGKAKLTTVTKNACGLTLFQGSPK